VSESTVETTVASSLKQSESDGRGDFDFFIGSWTIQSRRLREWLKGSTSWDELRGASVVRKVLGGLGHIEEATLDGGSEIAEELVVRLFDPTTRQWSVYEADGGNGFDPHPIIARSKYGRMEGYAHIPWEGAYIFRRVVWSEITGDSFHWEQAFSADGGVTWETNWIADFVRTDEID